MVPRVKLAYDNVRAFPSSSPPYVYQFAQKVFPIIHPGRRNLTAIRGYVRLGGLPDNPRTDPQDRAWFGPHDRLFIEEESEPIEFTPGPEYGGFYFNLRSQHRILTTFLQYGAGDGTGLEIWTDRT